ncbi:MAG: 1-acyl-sn-glycerol-3-phosphate acyltransferase [Treponema sp.]|jgi:1-acyl-sn-glycerol-3-phosphate acyltransferase|nr:1-acyl-sn-glycerol-3-phosphate acyltransferase [Treponema sp.]
MVKRGFHVQVYRLFCLILGPLLRAVFQYQGRVLRQIPAPAIIVANHNTDIDPILLGLSFPRHSYFVASEHIFRWGPVSWLLRLLFAPIIRAKGGANTQTVMEILGTLREGYNVSIFAEGNRSFSGVTGPVLPATGKLVRASGAHLVTFRFRGGYFASPRWGRRMRKGPIRGELVGVYSPEQLSTMKAAEITGLIQRDIHEDAYESQARDPRAYRSRAPAEDLETGLYLCPECGRMGALSSRASRLYCSCGLEYRYDEYGALQRLKGPSNGGGGGAV